MTAIKALIKAQSEMGKALKNSSNLHFKSKYADLSSVVDATIDAFTNNGFAVLQPCDSDDQGNFVETILLHESDVKFNSKVYLTLSKQDMQGLGSAITYARRYGLLGMAGIAPEDDDGNASIPAKKNSFKEGMDLAWLDSIKDSLPTNYSSTTLAIAVAKQLCVDFSNYKTVKGLDGAWNKRKIEIERLKNHDQNLYDTVIDAFENKHNELTERKVA